MSSLRGAVQFRWDGRLQKGNHEPLISKELFDQVQGQLKRFNKSKEKTHTFAFRGLLTCGYCGCSMTAEIHKGKYIYYRCTGGRGKCRQPFIREEEVALRLGRVVKAISIDESLVEWIKEALKASHAQENEYHKRVTDDLKKELSKLENRIARVYEDKLDGNIQDSEWRTLHDRYSLEIEGIKGRLNRHIDANIDYYEKGSIILELAQDAYNQYLKQSNGEKKKLLDFVLSNCIVKGDDFEPVYRQPFDLLAVYREKEDQEKRRLGQKSPIHQLWRPQGDANPNFVIQDMDLRLLRQI
ncbi:MAG: recombinase zinc beta ribbon domain-containing protein [candidate division Zixibacteria bacterium]|nr:recombinase zinc beta ribbon domain-containing protein [candidate division Zixibacteria bacterium]